MKKIINTAFFYAILAMVFGVFYREYTEFINFNGVTNLSLVHTHLFTLGMFFFLIMASLNDKFKITEHKFFNKFYIIYNVGLIIGVIILVVRGIVQANELVISKGLDAAISGISGIGHIMLGVGIVLYFIILKSNIIKQN